MYYTDTMGSEQRLPVYAVAGGVIGYGLSYMNNMLNHGTISSTDVAGGVVGATYVLGGSTGPETIVNITTAVNYGEIKSIPTGSFDSDINSVNLILNNELTIESVSNQYMVDGNPYIFPSGYTREGPRGKRGFGGIFGRLQRGNLGTMTAAGGSFNFIVNANPNIDLIGRIDQVGDFSNTVTAYQFNGAIYYSANRNDTTQVVFTGFNYTTEYSYNGNYRDNVYQIIDVNYLGYTQEGSNYNHEYYIIGQYYNGHSQQGIINDPETVYAYIDEVVVSSSSSEPGSSYFVGQTLYNDNDDQYYYVGGRRIPWITEDPNDFYITDITNQFMYDSGFPMRENSNLTKYIYYAEYNLLANRFRELGHDNDGTGENTRLNGMYVLATTAGQEFGAVLPRNINPESMELINEDVNLSIINLDYDNLNLAPSETVNLSDEVLLKYEDLYQTRYNNKADLTESTLQNITLHENPGGSNTSLSLPNIDYETKKITFSVSMEAFSSTQESVSYNIFDALTSANALIADRLQDFRIDDLIFTEYIEGSGNNQAIEIYNGTGDSIDLSLYSIALYLGSSTTMAGSISLSGTLLDGDTYVIANSSASAQILAVADLTSVYVSYLTGDDKIVLNKGATVIDSIGKVGDSSSYAQDVTLTRKLMKRDVSTSDTYEVDYYWESHSIDTFSYLGDYTFGLSDLSLLLYYERYDEISTDYPALLEVDLPDYQTPIDVNLFIGSFSIYSEAFINNTLFASSEYFNDYDIYITFTPNMANTSGTTGIRYIAFNGGSNIALSTTTEFINPQPSSLNITARGDVNYNGSLKLIFNDEKDALNEGYDFKDNFVLYYMSGTNEVEVDLEYYSVTSVPQTSAGVYEITFDFSNALIKTGNYRIKYKYFSGSSNTYEVNFDKSASSESTIYDLDYYSYDEEFVPTGTNFTTQINMGKIPNINGNTNNFTPVTIDPLNPLYREYLSNTSYNISFMNSDSFIISDFAVVTRAQLRTDLTSYSNGYITYVIEYDIEAENGTPQTYTHSITERAVSLNAVYKDGNDVALDNITTTREANSTQFAVDLEFDQTVSMSGPVVYTLDNELSSYLTINVTGVNPDNNAYLPEEIVGLEFSTANLLYIQMSDQTLPGTYTFTIAYYRGESIGSISFANLVVTKLEGTDAYLTDIKFSPIASEAVYPSIDITDSEYNEITQIYNPAVYFFGIDYDGADLANYQYFSINGQVNNIPLESYYPYMLDYLPLGATVARYDETRSDWASNGYYSPEVNASSTDEELKVLAADFTQVATINGTEQNVPILYRISSEGEISEGVKSEVFYFITVNDVTYNLTLSFDVYYCDDNDFCVLANTTTEFTEVIQLNSYNLYIHSNDVVYTTPLPDENNPLYYPVFDRISGLYNSMTHFIYTDSTNINYRFGRNRSGFYIFEVILPRDEYLNEMYTYEIEFDEYLLNDINAVDFPPFESDVSYNGKYYFIMPSEVNRTRKFNIYIYRVDVSEDKPFGLFDIFRTWG
ncbi:MAG: lamin tail domain-containing protein [Candidatus Izemoplasmatales bacterium]